MKWFIFKQMLWAGMLMAGVLSSLAQTRHDEKLEKYKTIWNSLVPSYNKLQYAGSMGLLSFGVGWDYGKKNQWETDLFIGYLPKFDGKEGHVTFTLKENYIPWKKTFGKERWLAEPLTVSLYINKILGDEFWDKEPDRYPDRYYGVAPNLRFNLAFGQRINYKIKPVGLSNQIGLFYEFATNDLYVISYFTNKYLSLTDIFSLSVGIKFQFM